MKTMLLIIIATMELSAFAVLKKPCTNSDYEMILNATLQVPYPEATLQQIELVQDLINDDATRCNRYSVDLGVLRGKTQNYALSRGDELLRVIISGDLIDFDQTQLIVQSVDRY